MRRALTRFWTGVLFASLLALCTLTPRAQVLPDTLIWEPVGEIEQADWLAFDADTLYTGIRSISGGSQQRGILTINPDTEEWAVVERWDWYSILDDICICPPRALFTHRGQGLWLYPEWDGGSTLVNGSASTLPVETPSGALLIGVRKRPFVAARSTDGGLTWTDHGSPDIPTGLTPIDLVVLPPTPSLHEGRIVAAGFGGLATSDDDGRTWTPTAFYAGGPAFSGWAAARIEPGPYDGGHGGSVLAIVEGNGGGSGVFRSADGVEWEGVSAFPGVSRYESRLLAAPDGAVYLYETRRPSGTYYRGKTLGPTTDAGETWQAVGPVWEAWSTLPSEIELGPDGRLWASALGRADYTNERLGGVFGRWTRWSPSQESPRRQRPLA